MKPTDDPSRELAKSLAYLVEQHGWRSFVKVLREVCLSKAEKKQRWQRRAKMLQTLQSLK
jgi:hypothetical protein